MIWALLTLLLICCVYQGGFFLKRRTLLDREWEEVVTCISPIHKDALKQIDALASVESLEAYTSKDIQIVWSNIGGLRGVWKLKRNVECMLDLAVYAEQWDDDFGSVFAELTRLDALRMRRVVYDVLAIYMTIRWKPVLLERLQQVARSYDSARVRTIAIYQRQHAGLLPKLQLALCSDFHL